MSDTFQIHTFSGFPHWPAKAMSVNSSGLVDVRFFGAHDRAWVPAKDCYLYSEKDPNNFRTKRQDILDSMQVCPIYGVAMPVVIHNESF